ncbi:MAG: YebC/PmpR family DNA-binding transcriptional regulator [Candidatus Competibacteraceae bacterium]|nr:YebC/PmpR family DNA-binding transcriptional regulator [Candidatus Competibacteraceae bacterium]
MGRIFEKRKHKIFARNAKISKLYTKFGKEIAIAVKAGGPTVENNPRLKQIIQNARGADMPKDRIEAAIKRASDKGSENYEEVVYEGYGPYGVAVVVETATDNTTRTVANIRMYFNRAGGSLGTQGSLDFMFTRMGVFQIKAEGQNLEELELDLIDFGAEDIGESEGVIYVYTTFENFGKMQKALDEKGIEVINAELQRIPVSTAEVTEEQEEEIARLIERIEEDDDVTNVFHNMK